MKFHLIGICGTGMASLAGLLKKAGHQVRGSDREAFPPMSIQLEMLEIPVLIPYKAENLDWQPDAVVVGNVCSADHVEVLEAEKRGIKMASMAETIENRFLKKRRSIVIAGTHGKTTSASLTAHLLTVAGRNPSYLIGGIPLNYGMSFRLGSGRDFVIEGDEYDTAFFDKKSKFLHYRPKFALLTGVEFDHADIFPDLESIYETFKEFVATIPETGTLVAHESVPGEILESARCRVHLFRAEGESERGDDAICSCMAAKRGQQRGSAGATGGFGVQGADRGTGGGDGDGAIVDSNPVGEIEGGSETAAERADDRRTSDGITGVRLRSSSFNDIDVVENALGQTQEGGVWVGRVLKQENPSGAEVFQLISPDGCYLGTFRQTLAGYHNVLNTLGCLVIAHSLGLDWHDLAEGLSSFRGVQRRQEIYGVAMGVTVIDDFAHHPTAVRETLAALNSRFAGRRIIAVFEPRSATSRRRVFQDDFGEALSFADEVVISKVYNADALPPEDRLDPEELASKIRAYGTRARCIREVDDIVDKLAAGTRPGDIVVVMSSGSFGGIHEKLLRAIGDPITRATISDLEAMEELLEPLDLVPYDFRAHFDEFQIIRGEEGLVGCVGLEARGHAGLIKCMAIVEERRGEGLGYMLGQSALEKAVDMGLSHVYLFGTESTYRIGQMLGFSPFSRQDVEQEMAASPEFNRTLYMTAKLMRKDISSATSPPENENG